jgi:hypothetical protein
MATTTAAAVREAIALVIEAGGTTVFRYGAPAEHSGRTFTVISAVRWEQEQLSFGDNRQEALEVELVTFHKYGGSSDADAAVAEANVLEAAEDVETSLRADPTLGAVVFHSEPSSSGEITPMADEDGWVFQVTTTVDVEAHI